MPENWIQWDFPTPFLLETSCVNECPFDLYSHDYNNYTWTKNEYYDAVIVTSNPTCQTSSLYSKDNLSVKVTLNGASSTLMNSANGVLLMDITNKRGNINYYKFTQIDPSPDPNNPLTNVFPLISGSSNQYVNKTNTVDLNPNTLNNYPQGTNFKVKAEVRNDCGDIAIGYINFALATSPTIGDAIISCPSTPCKVQESMTITLTGDWYNSQPLVMELYVKIEFKFSDSSVVLIVPEQWQAKKFIFEVPVISSISNNNIPVSLLITATNTFDKSISLTKSMTIDNTLTSDFRSTLYSSKVDYSNLQNIVLLGAQMKQTLSIPQNYFKNQDLWQRSEDWFSNGICIKQRNGNLWDWYEGYSGVDWSINSQELSKLNNNVYQSLLYLTQYLTTNSLNGRNMIEMQITALSYILIRPELIDYKFIKPLTQIIQSISDLDDSTLFGLPDDFVSVYLNIMSMYFGRVMYEFNLKMKKSTMLLNITHL